MGGHHDHPGMGIGGPDRAHGFDAIHARHGDVHGHHIRFDMAVIPQRFRAVLADADHLMAKLAHHDRELLGHDHGIVNDHHSPGHQQTSSMQFKWSSKNN